MTTIGFEQLHSVLGGQAIFAPCPGIDAKHASSPKRLNRRDWSVGIAECGYSKAEANRVLASKGQHPLSEAELAEGRRIRFFVPPGAR